MRRSLLPAQLPDVAGFAFASRYVAGDDGEVGGDWYDVFTLPSGAVCVVVGDVVGHGLAAAQSMSQVRAVLRSTTLRTDDPARGVGRRRRARAALPAPHDGHGAVRGHRPGHRGAALVLGRAPTARPRPSRRRDRRAEARLPTCRWGSSSGTTATTSRWRCRRGRCCACTPTGWSSGAASSSTTTSRSCARRWLPRSPESVCVDVMRRLVGVETPRDDVAVLVLQRLPVDDPTATG